MGYLINLSLSLISDLLTTILEGFEVLTLANNLSFLGGKDTSALGFILDLDLTLLFIFILAFILDLAKGFLVEDIFSLIAFIFLAAVS